MFGCLATTQRWFILMSAVPPTATEPLRRNELLRCAISCREQIQQTTCANAPLFDHLVGALLELHRHVGSEFKWAGALM
jgi:hypothetical protein